MIQEEPADSRRYRIVNAVGVVCTALTGLVLVAALLAPVAVLVVGVAAAAEDDARWWLLLPAVAVVLAGVAAKRRRVLVVAVTLIGWVLLVGGLLLVPAGVVAGVVGLVVAGPHWLFAVAGGVVGGALAHFAGLALLWAAWDRDPARTD